MIDDRSAWPIGVQSIPRVRRLLFQQSVEARLGDGFVDFGLCAAAGDAAEGLSVDLDRQAALVGEVFGEGQGFDVAFLDVVGRVFGRATVESGVASLFLSPGDGVERGGVALLQEEEVAAVVDNDDGDADVALFGFGFGGGDHDFDGGEVDVFFGWEVSGESWRGQSEGEEQSECRYK